MNHSEDTIETEDGVSVKSIQLPAADPQADMQRRYPIGSKWWIGGPSRIHDGAIQVYVEDNDDGYIIVKRTDGIDLTYYAFPEYLFRTEKDAFWDLGCQALAYAQINFQRSKQL